MSDNLVNEQIIEESHEVGPDIWRRASEIQN